ncbi:DNA polymerase theta-like [Penaeus indicus]|uniref:DNA polymerase theta-like n=1 Tax=Penaeus indicus TaxID=29960 RepID=UPI00300D73B3
MEHSKDSASVPRRKFLGRFAVPVNSSGSAGRGKFSPPLLYGNDVRKAGQKPTAVVSPSMNHDCTFGDSFCNDDILDGVCEIEAQYVVSSKKRRSSVLFSSNSPNQGKKHGKRRRTQSNCGAEMTVNGKHCPYPGDKENVLATPIGADTLEAIDALDLDEDAFPDEVTSWPEQSPDIAHKLGTKRTSMKSRSSGNRSNVFVDISPSEGNVTLRRSQRIRVKSEEERDTSRATPIHGNSDGVVVCGSKNTTSKCPCATPKRRGRSKDEIDRARNILNTAKTSARLVPGPIAGSPESHFKEKLDKKSAKTLNGDVTRGKTEVDSHGTQLTDSPVPQPDHRKKRVGGTVIAKESKEKDEVNNALEQLYKGNDVNVSPNNSSRQVKLKAKMKATISEQSPLKMEGEKSGGPSPGRKAHENKAQNTSKQSPDRLLKPFRENKCENGKPTKPPGENCQSHVESGVTEEVKQPARDCAQVSTVKYLPLDKPENVFHSQGSETTAPPVLLKSNSPCEAKELERISAVKEPVSPDFNIVQASPRPKTALRSPFADSKNVSSFISTQAKMEMASWGLPEAVLERYVKNGIQTMFPWQAECLSLPEVLNGKNLVYSAPTSAGKTLVAELLLLKRVIETGRKGVFILPFVSVAREKMYYLQKMFGVVGVRVEGFMGSQGPPGGLRATDIAVCTIEKANNLVNRLLEDQRINELGIIVVDEVHMLADSHRGYLLELLLTKVMYMSNNLKEGKQGADGESGIQIVGMSATLPNLDLLSHWLSSQLYSTDFRPIPLQQTVKIGKAVYDSSMTRIRDLDPLLTVQGDSDHLIQLCLETVLDGLSVLVFCPTKAWCEKLAEAVAREFFNIGKADSKYPAEVSIRLRASLDSDGIARVMQAMRKCPVGLDNVLARSIAFGAAYHHAGLTFDERDIIEGGFRTGSIRVLIATSTLSSGVNLPARRVIIRSPVFGGKILDTQTYRQMIGRAGRKGVDTEGESVLICREGEQQKAQVLMTSSLPAITSCLQQDASLTSSMKRAILEVIVSGIATSPEEVERYSKCTLLAASLRNEASSSQADTQNSILNCVEFLEENEFIRLQEVDGSTRYTSTQLGCAVLASGLSPDEGLHVFSELYRARKCFVLENELHIIYQVTPVYVSSAWPNMDWLTFLSIWESLSEDMKRVAELVGVEESFIVRAMKGTVNRKVRRQAKQLAVHQRFYTALALHELVQEVPLNTVARKYAATRGMLQSLQQSAATFAGMVTVFCNRLGWHSMELLLAQFQDRLHFGIQRELCDLVRLTLLNGQRARDLYNAGLETVARVAHATPREVEDILIAATPFHSNKMGEEEHHKGGTIWLSSGQPLTEAQAAVLIVKEARLLVQKELGITNIDWTKKTEAFTTPSRNMSLSQGGSNTTRRSVSSVKSRNSISPNLILRSELVLGKNTLASRIVEGGVEESVTPLRRSKKKQISPATRLLRRISKSPQMDLSLDRSMKKRRVVDSNEKQNRMNCSDNLPKQKTSHSETIGCTSTYNSKDNREKSNHHSSIVNKNDGINDHYKPSTVSNDIIPELSHKEKEISHSSEKIQFSKVPQTNDSVEKRREVTQDQQKSEASSNRRERKDLKGRIKNRRSVGEETADSALQEMGKGEKKTEIIALEETGKNFVTGCSESEKRGSVQRNEAEAAQEDTKRTEISKVKDIKDSVKESENRETAKSGMVITTTNAGEEPKNPKKKPSSIAGLLFGKSKPRKKEIEAIEKQTVDESDSFCIPESQEDKADNLFSPKRRQRVPSKEKEAHITSVCVDLEKLPRNKPINNAIDDTGKTPRGNKAIEKHIETNRESGKGKSTDVNTSTPVVERLKTTLAVRATTPISDSLDGIIANLSFNDSQAIEENGSIFKDESDLFKESDVGEVSGDAGKLEDNICAGEKHQGETLEGEKQPHVESHLINDSIGLLSESQKDNFFRTLGSQDFDVSEPEEHLEDKLLACSSNRQQELEVDEEEMEIDEKGMGVVQEHFSVLFSNDLIKKKYKEAKNAIVSVGVRNQNQAKLTACSAVLPIKTPLDVQNKKQKIETPMYQACSEELDFGFDLSRTENRAPPEAKQNINTHKDGSYLSISSERFPQVEPSSKRSLTKQRETHDAAHISFSEDEVPNLEYLSDGEFDQNVCEVLDEDVGENVHRGDDTLSDSFLDQAFESYLHLSSNTDESEESIGLPGATERAPSGASGENEESSNVLEKNCLGDTFGELNMTPGTEALLDGLVDCPYKKSQCRESVLLEPKQTGKGRLSDDLFATPVSPAPRRRSQKECTGDKKRDAKRGRMEDKTYRLHEPEDSEMSSSAGPSNIVKEDGKKQKSEGNNYLDEGGPSDSGGTVTRSLSIINVVNNSKLFECFKNEWSEQRTYSIALACEKAPSQQTKGGIGWKVTGQSRTPRRSQRPLEKEVAGLVVENTELLLVGMAVCWGGRDAYYINLRTVQEEAISCSLPTPPLSDAVPLKNRIEVIRKVIAKAEASSTVRVWDAKTCVRLLAAAGLGILFTQTEDPRVASWMLDPGAKEQNLYNMVMTHDLESLPLLEGVGSSWGLASLGVNDKNPGSCRVRAATEAVVVYQLMRRMRCQLKEIGMLQAFEEVEMPSVVTLACMEMTGMGFSNLECEAQKAIMQKRMSELEKEMYSQVGHPFSLTSPDEVSQVLYCELRLPLPAGASSHRGGRGRGGRGGRGSRASGPTNKDTLEKLSQHHTLPAKILEWRRISSSLTKILFPLQQERVYNPSLTMDRIHTSTHTFTATGRVTMHEPNLQNVPKDFNIQVAVDSGEARGRGMRAQQRALANSAIMSQLGPLLESEHEGHTVSLRHAFVACPGSCVLLAADYSQLELRLLAHLASCEKLLRLLNGGEDVFTSIAGQIHMVEPGDVTTEWRQQAKQICYGMLYGMGARALGEQLGVDENDAQTFMDRFMGRFPGVRRFLQTTVEDCRKKGYVLTLMGRRRYLPNINSQNVHARAQSERQAINTAIQGSAADLVKLAMVRIARALKQAFPRAPSHLTQPTSHGQEISGAFLVLQLHDELLYEVVSDDVIQVAQLVRSHMEGVRQLAVSLPVKIKVGPSWGSMQTLNL